MTQLLHIGNDPSSREYTFLENNHDFVVLVDERLGREAADFVAGLIESKEEALTYSRGYKDGYTDGYEAGYEDGEMEGYCRQQRFSDEQGDFDE